MLEDASMVERNVMLISKREVTDVHNHIQMGTMDLAPTSPSSIP